MKATKKNLIKYLEASIENCHSLANYFEKNGDEATSSKYLNESNALRDIIFCLNDSEYFTRQYKNMVKEEE